MGHIKFMATVLFYVSREIISLTYNYKIKLSFVDSLNTSLFSSNKKTQQKEICSKISYQ